MIGLGKMGGNMVRRLRQAGIDVVGFSRESNVRQSLADETGLIAADSLEALLAALPAPRLVWLMLPAGDITASYVHALRAALQPGDMVVDGANSWYKDSMRHGELLAAAGLEFADAGVSGGVWGLQKGYALMVGASDAGFARMRPLVEVLAPARDRGWVHAGPVGSGHFVKMIHNGIEYGMMQAYAEGFALLHGRKDFALDLAAIAETWRHGSVVRSWLLDLTTDVLNGNQDLSDIAPYVADSGEGRWTAQESIEQGIPAPVMSLALMMRFASQGKQDYASKLLAMMRNQFGGHAVQSNNE